MEPRNAPSERQSYSRISRWFAVLAVAVAMLTAVTTITLSPNAEAGTPPMGFTDSLVTAGLASPRSLAFLPDASGRAIIVQEAGAVLAWDGVTLSTLHTMTEVLSGGERGLLGVEVDPAWPARPYLYVVYTATTGFVQVARFDLTDSGGALVLSPASKLILIDDMPDISAIHNGGALRFAPDRTLYISVGDDGLTCDAQDLTILAGKILRIRVDDSIDPENRATLAPPDNPFASDSNDNAKLVWAYGLRNPFRFDIDPLTGDVFVGDVGQDSWEEVSLADAPGLNLGWPYLEAFATFRTTPCPVHSSIPATHPPVYVYPNPVAGTASVIGASIYRGVDYPVDDSFPPAFDHDFFFMDFFSGFLRVLRHDPSSGGHVLVPGMNATDWGTSYAFVPDMVVGPDGALYFVTTGGPSHELRRIAYTATLPAQPASLVASLANVLDDIMITWTPSNPEAGVDHYEVWRSVAFDAYRGGYAQVSPDLTPGSTTWLDVGAGVTPGAYFYFVQAVGVGGETSPSPGQVAKFTRAVASNPTLLSTSVITPTLLVPDNLQGTATWSIARTFDAWDSADPWKGFDPTRAGNDFLTVDRTRGVWVDVTVQGDLRIIGKVPCSTTLKLRFGWNLVGYPSMMYRTLDDAIAALAGPVLVEGFSAANAPHHLERLGPTSSLGPTDAVWIFSPVDQTWTVENDLRPSCA